jgi:hypothetical protein
LRGSGAMAGIRLNGKAKTKDYQRTNTLCDHLGSILEHKCMKIMTP